MKEYQEFLLRQLKEDKIAIESISFSHAITVGGRIGVIEIDRISFASAKQRHDGIDRIIVPELKEEVIKQLKIIFK